MVDLTDPREHDQAHLMARAIAESRDSAPPIDPLNPPKPPVTEAPVNVDVPYLGGEGAVGNTLDCTMGTWEGEPTSYVYAWRRDGTELGSGEANTYIVTTDDAGHSIACVVAAANAVGSTSAPPSNEVAVPPPARSASAPVPQTARNASASAKTK